MTPLGPRGLALLAMAFTIGAVAVPAEAREMRDTEARLLRDLQRTASFRALIPARREITRLEFAGTVLPGDLVYGSEPEEIAVVPRVLSATLARNCASAETRAVQGTMSGAFTDSMSLTTTQGWEIGGSVQFKAGWPAAETTWTVNASYSGSVARATDESETWSVSQGWSSPVLPRTEFDVQLQVIQQQIEGQAYTLDLELRGPAVIHHRPILQWVASRGSVPAGAVIGGRERSPTTGDMRDLPVCRARYAGTTHPGKVVAGRCNISYGRDEHEIASFEVLVADAGALSWERHRGGSTNAELGVVAGQERRDDQHEGRLYVCRAEHRGGTHPGKLVINDCMFGYGGKEIQAGSYEILTFNPDSTASFRVNLQDHLSAAQRSFRVEGEFRGTKALSTTIVFGESRPVDAAGCPGVAPSPVARATDAPAARSVSVTRAGPGAVAMAVSPARPAAPAPIAGEVYSRADVSAGAPEQAELESRWLRLEQPHMFGADVLALQEALREAGWPVRADGFLGPRTDQALRHFQQANDLVSDGIFGPATKDRLGL